MNLQSLRDILTECQTQAAYHEGKAEAWNDAARLIEGKIESEEASPSISEGDTLTFSGPNGEEFTATVKDAATSADGGEVTVNAVKEPIPSGTVALEYKFGVGDVIVFEQHEWKVSAFSPVEYVLENDKAQPFIYRHARIEEVDTKATLIRRAGEGEKQPEKEEPLKVGDSVEAAVPGSMPHLHLPATIEHLPDSEFAWVRNADNHLGLVLLSSLRRVSPPAPEKPADKPAGLPWSAETAGADLVARVGMFLLQVFRTPHSDGKWLWEIMRDCGRVRFSYSTRGYESQEEAKSECEKALWALVKPVCDLIGKSEDVRRTAQPARPAYKAGQVWRNKEGDLLTLISQHLGLGGWYWTDHNGAKGFSYFPQMDRHWTFVSDAPEAAP